jgi:hypothetical protein
VQLVLHQQLLVLLGRLGQLVQLGQQALLVPLVRLDLLELRVLLVSLVGQRLITSLMMEPLTQPPLGMGYLGSTMQQ